MTRPRDWCGGKSFRDADPADWRPSVGDDPIELASAWAHFRLARRILDSISRNELTLQRLADALGVTYEDQRRKVNGDQPLNDKDVALWTLVTTAEDEPDGDFGGLLPPGSAKLAGPWQPGQWLPVLTAASAALPLDTSALLSTLVGRIAEAEAAGVAECVDAGALRYFVVESFHIVGIGPHHIHITAGDADVTIGTPEQVVLRAVCLPAALAYDRQTRLDALRLTAKAIIDMAEHPAPVRYVLLLGHRRSLATIETILPPSTLRTHGTSAIGPFDGIDPRWVEQAVDVTPFPAQDLRELSLHLIEVGKSHRLN